MRPIVDMLLGLDCADLIYAIQEVRGKPEESIARLTPLGWTCIGNISSEHQEVIMSCQFCCLHLLCKTSG